MAYKDKKKKCGHKHSVKDLVCWGRHSHDGNHWAYYLDSKKRQTRIEWRSVT
jgi:hypothetical protein